MSNQYVRASLIGALGLGACTATGDTSQDLGRGGSGDSAHLTGAIFTTTVDGSRVNANIYSSKDDVYLDGGPGEHAPPGAAGLPAGDYYFQVTDPSGRTLLSQDDIACRRFLVSSDGVIVRPEGPCPHLTGIDQDHAELGAITIQLMPYADTPNPGGEYKAWATPVDKYDPSDTRTNGFVNRYSKTDNFKVRTEVVVQPPPPPPPVCGDGHVDAGEQCDDGNTVDGDGCSANCQTETPPPPPPLCGNGVIDEGEQCDDGALNGTQGDTCSATCECLPQ